MQFSLKEINTCFSAFMAPLPATHATEALISPVMIGKGDAQTVKFLTEAFVKTFSLRLIVYR